MTRDLTDIADELATHASKDNALVKFRESFKPIGHTITANRDGFIRLAVECLIAAQHRNDKNAEAKRLASHAESLKYLASGDFDTLSGLYRDDEMSYEKAPPPIKHENPKAARISLWVNLFFGTMFICTIIGAVTVCSWVWNAIW